MPDLIDEAWRELLEKDDRTSPAEYPDMVLITRDELAEIVTRVFVQCSECSVDLWEMKPKESIDVRRAYYCADCDPGATVLNMPRERK